MYGVNSFYARRTSSSIATTAARQLPHGAHQPMTQILRNCVKISSLHLFDELDLPVQTLPGCQAITLCMVALTLPFHILLLCF